eukprot:snap_masked-scaffold161_size295871-processed-gene-1.19 protein:Tk05111 transcript:snap_masked-scaffold161_size295871-processed-gene-1.19-mRNA-1 annotation:"venom carboxylesterase-6-like"
MNRTGAKDPEPIEPWTNIFDGRQDGPSCPQIPALFEDGVKGDEDCLWLSVFTKFLPGDRPRLEPRPVLIWIHGGRWVIGSAQTSLYSPDYLLEHELVIVHLQYRLGALGYLSTEDSVAPGNYGLKDQVVALKWIKNNIEDFGGDPKQITIMGHSAGAASAHAHVLSPMSRGLFQRAISLSGTANNFWAFRTVDQESVAKRQAKLLNCPTKGSKALIQCLRRVDFRSLTSSQADLYDLFPRSEAKLPLSPTVPRIDVESPNPFLALDPLEHLRSGDFDQHIPWMTGLTSQEGSWYSVSLFGSKHQQRLAVANFNQRQTLQHMTRAPTISQAHEFERIMVQVFGNQSFQSEKHRIAGAEFFSDLLFNAEVLQAIYLQSIKSKSSVYFHRFDYMGGFGYTELFGDKQAHHGGVAHLDDIRYVMSRYRANPYRPPDALGLSIRDFDHVTEQSQTFQPMKSARLQRPLFRMEPSLILEGHMEDQTINREYFTEDIPKQVSRSVLAVSARDAELKPNGGIGQDQTEYDHKYVEFEYREEKPLPNWFKWDNLDLTMFQVRSPFGTEGKSTQDGTGNLLPRKEVANVKALIIMAISGRENCTFQQKRGAPMIVLH